MVIQAPISDMTGEQAAGFIVVALVVLMCLAAWEILSMDEKDKGR